MILSIIIPVFNVEKYVEKCVRSCETQDIPSSDYEVICVNDGSKDNSLQIIESLAAEYDNIKIVSQQNGGLSAARNTGMFHAGGDYYMFVDSDDWIAENCLGKLVRKLKYERPDALAICAANMIGITPKRRKSYLDETPISGKELLRSGVEQCAPFSIWSAQFFKKHELRFVVGIYHEDAEFTPRAYYLAEKVSFCNDLIYFVYQNPTSITRTFNPKKSFDLLNTVCTSLSKFVMRVDDDYKVIFYNMIALNLNNAMYFMRWADRDKQEKFKKDLSRLSYLWKDIAKSSILKYRVEAYLVRILPLSPFTIYKMMQILARK